MSEIYEKDESIHEPTTAHMHPLETTPQGSQADSAEGQHEHRDVSFGALGKWLIGLFVLIMASFLLMIWFFDWAVKGGVVNDELPSAMFSQRPNPERSWPNQVSESPLQSPDEVPTLLPDPEAPMVELRRQEIDTLEKYDWAKDENGKRNGKVTIPIDRAIELTAQRGLPAEEKTQLRPPTEHADIARPGAHR